MKKPGACRVFLFSSNYVGKLDLIRIKLHAGMIHIELLNFFDTRLFVIDKNLQVDVAQQIQVNFITIVPYGHHKCSIFIKKVNLF